MCAAFATPRRGRASIPPTSPRFDARGDARMRVDARERASACVASYLAVVLLVSARSRRAFLGKFGRRHRISGGAHLCVLTLYVAHAVRRDSSLDALTMDATLFVSGLALTLTAHRDFAKAHEHAERRQLGVRSGVLHAKTAVTGAEMLEHAFYHVVNGFQIAYVHCVAQPWFARASVETRAAACLLATSAWTARGRFPINSFSNNYRDGMRDFESCMYRVKKWQYVLYKTVLLHGLNVSLAMRPVDLISLQEFRSYWFCLNAAYVLEFFLQTLVKRKYLRQRTMLVLNLALMLISTLAVVPVLRIAVEPHAAAMMFALNFLNRKRELENVVVGLVVAALWADF